MLEDEINADYEYEIKAKLTDEELYEKIKKILNITNLKEIYECDVKIRDEKIKKLAIIEGASNIQISRVMRINRKMVDRAMKK